MKTQQDDTRWTSDSTLLAVLLGLLALCVYWGSALLRNRVHTPITAFFPELADAFLHGRAYLINPPITNDLTFYEGQWYVPFPPLPALLLLPWASLSAILPVNTIFFGAVIGALNVGLTYALLNALRQRRWTQLDQSDNIWLTVLLAVGSVHWYMSTLGSIWFLSQICTVTFMLLAILAAVQTGSPILSGTALALAMLGRPHVILCYPLLVAIAITLFMEKNQEPNLRASLWWGVRALGPLMVSGILLLSYNYLRFKNILDFGYLRQNVAAQLVHDLQTYGQFNLHYVPQNLWIMLLAGPDWDASTGRLVPNEHGMSLLLTTPALLLIVRAQTRSVLVLGAWLALGLLLIPLVTYYNTGWTQFGYRFSLDFMAPALILLAIGSGRHVGRVMQLLILIGVAINAWGTSWY